jgi:hypothetical protein
MKRFLLIIAMMAAMLIANAQNLVRGEYFVNADPGYGLATSFSIASPDSDITQSFNIPYNIFNGPGYHNIFFRVLDENGSWSQTSRRFVEVGENVNPAGIVEVEYFFDTDDEFGNNASVLLTASSDSTWLFNIPSAEIPVSWTNADVVYLRVKQNADTKWSHTTNTTIGEICTVDSTTEIISACNQYTWINGITYSSDNTTASHVLTNIGGCDSVVTLNLTITAFDTSVSVAENVFTSNAIGINYQWLNCTNGFAVIPNETNQNFLANANGQYAVQLSANGCLDTSSCYTYMVDYLNESIVTQNQGFQILPNPNNGQFDLRFNSYFEGIVEIVDITGKLIIKSEFSGYSVALQCADLRKGIYLIKALNSDGHGQTKRLVIN